MQSNRPPLLTSVQKQRQYFIGLLVGLIPLIVFLVSFGLTIGIPGNSGAFFVYALIASFILYVVEFIVTIVFLVIDRRRFIGYGLLTAFLASLDRLLRLALAGDLRDQTYVVYISPLRALSNDIQRNLQEPHGLHAKRGVGILLDHHILALTELLVDHIWLYRTSGKDVFSLGKLIIDKYRSEYLSIQSHCGENRRRAHPPVSAVEANSP